MSGFTNHRGSFDWTKVLIAIPVVLVCCVIQPVWFVCQQVARMRGRCNKDEASEPRPPKRRRNLSLTDNTGNANKSDASPGPVPLSRMGLFAKLPPELRNQIYTLALGGANLHLTYAVDGANLHLCYDPRDKSASTARQTASYFECPAHRAVGIDGPPPSCHLRTNVHPFDDVVPSGPGRLALLRACRQIYTEAVPLLYASNTFCVVGWYSLEVFVRLSRGIRPSRLAAIASLCVSYGDAPGPLKGRQVADMWGAFWHYVGDKGRMSGLREVGVHKVQVKEGMWMAMDADWVVPLLALAPLQSFELHVWPHVQHWGSGRRTLHKFSEEYQRKVRDVVASLQERICRSPP